MTEEIFNQKIKNMETQIKFVCRNMDLVTARLVEFKQFFLDWKNEMRMQWSAQDEINKTTQKRLNYLLGGLGLAVIAVDMGFKIFFR
jgi:hypothetical protein